MKTKLFTLFILSILLSACGDKSSRSADIPVKESPPDGKILLTTELPPEIIEGTPRPIILPLQTQMSHEHPQNIPARPVAAPPVARESTIEENSRAFLNPPPVDRERYGELTDNT